MTDYSLFYYFILWISFTLASLAFILIHGIDYVAWPRLLPPTDVIYYHGPGFRSGHHGKGLGGAASEAGARVSNIKTKWIPTGHKRASSRIEEIEMGTKKRVD